MVVGDWLSSPRRQRLQGGADERLRATSPVAGRGQDLDRAGGRPPAGGAGGGVPGVSPGHRLVAAHGPRVMPRRCSCGGGTWSWTAATGPRRTCPRWPGSSPGCGKAPRRAWCCWIRRRPRRPGWRNRRWPRGWPRWSASTATTMTRTGWPRRWPGRGPGRRGAAATGRSWPTWTAGPGPAGAARCRVRPRRREVCPLLTPAQVAAILSGVRDAGCGQRRMVGVAAGPPAVRHAGGDRHAPW